MSSSDCIVTGERQTEEENIIDIQMIYVQSHSYIHYEWVIKIISSDGMLLPISASWIMLHYRAQLWMKLIFQQILFQMINQLEKGKLNKLLPSF